MAKRYKETEDFLLKSNPPINLNFKIKIQKSTQKKVLNFFKSNKISCLTGDPGTGKTFLSIYNALKNLEERPDYKIIITKPMVEIGKSMGYLPGDEKEKISAYLDSYLDTFHKIIGEETTSYLIKNKKIVFEPLNFIRGVTYEYAFVILDEAQNATLHELVTLVTRVADNSLITIIGDDWQSDIKNSGFIKFIDLFASDVEGVDYMHLGEEYQMRSEMIVHIYKIYKRELENSK